MTNAEMTFTPKAWDSRAERDDGKLVPDVLDAASKMGPRDDYLINALLKTRGQKTPDASSNVIPADVRTRLLDLAEKQWAEKQWAEKANAPVDVRALERWRTMMEKAWVERSARRKPVRI